jgi:hypothetical protein
MTKKHAKFIFLIKIRKNSSTIKGDAMKKNMVLGVFCIVVGVIIAVIALGELLLRVLVACAGLWLINRGLIMRGSHQLKSQATTFFFKQRWF